MRNIVIAFFMLTMLGCSFSTSENMLKSMTRHTVAVSTLAVSTQTLSEDVEEALLILENQEKYNDKDKILASRLVNDARFIVSRMVSILNRAQGFDFINVNVQELEALVIISRQLYLELYGLARSYYVDFSFEEQTKLSMIDANLKRLDTAWRDIMVSESGSDMSDVVANIASVVSVGVKIAAMF